MDNNFDKLPENVRNELLCKLLEKKEVALEGTDKYSRDVVFAGYDFFDSHKFLEKDEVAIYVARTVAYNFDKLPKNLRVELLTKLSEKDGTRRYVAWAVAHNFDKLPENLKALLLKFLEKYEPVADKAWFENKKTDWYSWHVLQSMAGTAAEDVAWAVADNFDTLPENVRNELLIKLSKMPMAAENLKHALENHFDKVSVNLRNVLILKFWSGGIAVDNLDKQGKMNENSQNLILRIKLLRLLQHDT